MMLPAPDDAAGNMKDFEDAAEDLNGRLESLGDDVVGPQSQQLFDVGKVFCPDNHMQFRVEDFGVGQTAFREKTVGNGDDHDARALDARASEFPHWTRRPKSRLSLLFFAFDFLKIQIDHA